MSKNLIKQLHAQIKSHNHKLISTLKSDLNKEYDKKYEDLTLHFKTKESRIKKIYQSFLSKLEVFQNKQNAENQELKAMIDRIKKSYEDENVKRVKMNKKIEEIKKNLRIELKNEIEKNEGIKKKVDDEVGEMKKKMEGKMERMKKETHGDDIKALLSSLS